ncbi:MAG: ABC transporter permease [Candidatus Kariarchaeaceae archaeon]
MTEYGTAISIVVAATFLLIPTLGEIYAERSGVLNLGIEGIILSGAAGSFLLAHKTRHGINLGFFALEWSQEDTTFLGGSINIWIGIIMGMLIGILLSSIHAVLSITLNRNQIVSGFALFIFGSGLSGLLGQDVVGKSDEVEQLEPVSVPILEDIPVIGEIFFNHDVLVYLSFLLVPILWFVLFRTKIGIIIRTIGENPAAAHNQGIDVKKVRFLCVLFGGALAGLGGAYLSLAWLGFWSEGMTSARGWIVIALVIVALWHPVMAFFASYVFGAFWVIQFNIQSGVDVLGFSIKMPVAITNMLPYVITIVFLAMWGLLLSRSKVKRIVGAPSALTVPFEED